MKNLETFNGIQKLTSNELLIIDGGYGDTCAAIKETFDAFLDGFNTRAEA